METLDSTEWDVVISGTGLFQSLLALALSRSGKRILHLDRNDHYGGDEAALALSEAEEWALKHGDGAAQDEPSTFTHASVSKPSVHEGAESKLGFSRAYSLALAPQLIYARSPLLPALVSSRTHDQLEFQAVGSWFSISSTGNEQPTMVRVPNGREAVFQDATLDLRAKRSLMKFLRFVGNYDEDASRERWDEVKDMTAQGSLRNQFGLPDASIPLLLALALIPQGESDVKMNEVVPRIARHMRSIGLFGPGFSAVMPKWGGLAEVAQVACRACAVGGGVYVLGKAIVTATDTITLELSDGEKITSKWLVGPPDDLPRPYNALPRGDGTSTLMTRSISIIASPLVTIFPPTSEGGPVPAGAVVVVQASEGPVHILVHSSESGECPAGQCVLYAFTATTSNTAFDVLEQAVQSLLQGLSTASEVPTVLWKLQFKQTVRSKAMDQSTAEEGENGSVIILPPLSTDVVLQDDVLASVHKAWRTILGSEGISDEFMRYAAREAGLDDDNVEM